MKADIKNDYSLIPMSDIDPEAREIAVRWAENNGYNWIGDKHKLASDIMNYARRHIEKTLNNFALYYHDEYGESLLSGSIDNFLLNLKENK